MPGVDRARWTETGVRGGIFGTGPESERNPLRVLVPNERAADDLVEVRAVEQYDDGLIVRWQAISPLAELEEPTESALKERRAKIQTWAAFEVEDDLGSTPYEEAGMRARPAGDGESRFTPAVPTAATMLRLRRASGWHLEFDLSS